MSFYHASQHEALNQNLAELDGQIQVSFEFFPPRTEEMENTLWQSLARLNTLKPQLCFCDLWGKLWRTRQNALHY
ncbi:5,10-methylenetetrahydrofolate reductase [Proteus vulgaris]|nr:5,10-methylenetetrahydrofolate reductase [Proteus vulgaris]